VKSVISAKRLERLANGNSHIRRTKALAELDATRKEGAGDLSSVKLVEESLWDKPTTDDNTVHDGEGIPALPASKFETPEPVKLPPAQWFDRFIGLGANSRHVSSDDAIACVRLVVAELQGPQAARETEIRLVTPTVPLSALYAECMRLSGHAACWGVVQELQLKARAQQGVRPNQGVPVVALCRPPANGANWSSALAIDAQQVQMLLEQRCWPGV
jgi:hypothetical protein